MGIKIVEGDILALYEAIARGEAKRELLQRVFDMFGDRCGLRPPEHEERVAMLCDTRQVRNG